MNYTLIRARKRSLSLQVNAGGELIARAPLFMPKFLIDRFVNQKSTWVAKRLKELKKPRVLQVEHFTVAELKILIESKVKEYSRKMSLSPTGLRFTQVRSYWGTCTRSGRLSFNLALRYTPESALTYVVVHELAHLKWRGHTQRFWDLVVKYYPATKASRALLRQIPRSL